MVKRAFIVALAVGIILGTFGVAFATEFNWRQFEGESIRVWVPNILWTERLRPHIPEFEKLTGIKVKYDVIGEAPYRTSLPVELTGRSKDFDVMASMTVVDGLKFAQAGWYKPLDDLIKDPTLTNPDWDFNDFPEGIKKSAMQVNGQTVVVPWEAQTLLLFYRQDLFEKYGVAVPQTFEELEQAAKKLHRPQDGVYGISLRGAGLQTTTPFSAFLYGMGGSWLDADGNPAINTPESIAAMELYGRLGRLYGPPGIVNNSWIQTGEIFGQGHAAMLIDINIFVPTFEDPQKSAVAGKVGYSMVPAGPAGRKPFSGGWGFAINPLSKKTGPAWYFIQWATSKEMQAQAAAAGQPVPRTSAWENASFAPDLKEALMESFNIAHPYMNPPVTAALEARDIVGEAIIKALQGQDVKAAADEAQQKLVRLIEMTEGK